MRYLTVLLCALLLGACASVDSSKKSITLDKATRAYENAIRWGRFEAADTLRRLEGNAAPTDYDRLEKMKVTKYRVTGHSENDDRSEVTREVKIHYYTLDSMKEKELTDHQQWVYDPVQKTWYITTPLPAFR